MALTIPSLQITGGFPITPSDTTDITSDAGNTIGITFCYVHVSGASGTVKVDTVDGQTLTLYGVQGSILGGTMPVMVRRVYATSPVPPTVVALRGKVPYQ